MENFRLVAYGEGPNIMCVVIKKDNIIFVTGIAINGRSPDICMN